MLVVPLSLLSWALVLVLVIPTLSRRARIRILVALLVVDIPARLAWSLGLPLMVSQLFPLALQTNSLIEQGIETGETMTLQLVVMGSNQAFQKTFLVLLISIYFWSIARLLGKFISILTNGHIALGKWQELLFSFMMSEGMWCARKLSWNSCKVMLLASTWAAVYASHKSKMAPSSLPDAYRTLSWSLLWEISNFLLMALSQSLAYKGSMEWEKVGGC